MNNYFTLRRANRLRVKLLNSKSQEQIREVIRYLRRTSWDECGVELIYSDLIDMAVQANENGQELFNVIEDAKTFLVCGTTVFLLWLGDRGSAAVSGGSGLGV